MPLPSLALLPSRLRGPVRDGRGLLILASGGIGDNVLLSTVIDRFAEFAEPGEPVTVLLRKDAAGAAFLFPGQYAVETYDWMRFRRDFFYRWSFCSAIRKRRFRLVISTDYHRHPKVDEVILAACGTSVWGETARPSRKHPGDPGIFSRLLDAPGDTHRLIRWVNLANGLGGKNREIPSFPAGNGDGAPKSNIVLLHPFSADRRKELPKESFSAILAAIPAQFRVVLSCGPGDLDRHPEWRGFLAEHSLGEDLSSIEEKYRTLQTAAMLITIDTCMVHLGALAGTTTLTLCTDAYRGWAVPYEPSFSPPHLHFYTDPCSRSGCQGHCPYPLEQGAFRCLARLPLDRVIEDIWKLLGEP